MKNQKGITLMILVSTVIILALIIGTIGFNSMSSVKMQAYYNMYADIELLDEKIAIYYLENNKLPIDETDTQNITDLISDYNLSNVNYNPNNSGTLYKINLDYLQNLSLNYNDYYIDEQSHTIYFGDNIEIDGVKYYTVPIDYQEVNLNLYQ